MWGDLDLEPLSSSHVIAADAQTSAARDAAALWRRVFVNQGHSSGYVDTTGTSISRRSQTLT